MSNIRNYNYYFLDWKNQESDERYRYLSSRLPNVYKVNLKNSIIKNIRALGNLSDLEYFWILSSITDYTNFDFNKYNEIGLEPYLQTFGANTYFCSRYFVNSIPADIQYHEAIPNQHFIKTNLRFDKKPLDIVYISNGEPAAEEHYNHLLSTVKTGNRIMRVNRVKGRSQAYCAAARLSNTSNFFAVFAKLKVDSGFDWNWQPRYNVGPHHYIFHAHNPVNNLEYGHMAMVAYNKALTLSTEYTGLDFVLSKPHIVEAINSGTAKFDQDPVVTWRSAFRECLKLKSDPTVENLQRLEAWRTRANGPYGRWSTAGANDAMNYYNEVNGDIEKLKLSYEWEWLDQRFNGLYKK